MKHFLVPLTLFTALLLAGCELVHQFSWETNFDDGKVFVSSTRGDDNSNGSRGSPVRSVNAGIFKAIEQGYDTIYLEEGVYFSSTNGIRPGGTAHGVNLTQKNIRLIGGWLDDYSRQGDDEQYSIIWDDLAITDHLIYMNNITNIYFEKIAFVGGNANGTGNEAFGGAFYIESSSNITFTRCVFFNNSCTSNGGAGYISNSDNITFDSCYFENSLAGPYGGALAFTGVTGLTLNNCAFRINNANFGGAISVDQSSAITIDSCTFQSNTAGTQGGGLYFFNSNTITMDGNGIMQNSATQGGGMAFNTVSDLTMRNVFSQNFSTGDGGALYFFGGSTIEVNNSVFMSNFSTNASTTGGLYFDTVNSLTIREGYIVNTSVTGGGSSKTIFFANGTDIKLLQTYFDHSSSLVIPEQTISLGAGLSDIMILLNSFSGTSPALGYAIYEINDVTVPYRLEGNRFSSGTYSFLYHDAAGPTDYTDVDSLNNPANIGASSAFLNSTE